VRIVFEVLWYLLKISQKSQVTLQNNSLPSFRFTPGIKLHEKRCRTWTGKYLQHIRHVHHT